MIQLTHRENHVLNHIIRLEIIVQVVKTFDTAGREFNKRQIKDLVAKVVTQNKMIHRNHLNTSTPSGVTYLQR